MHSADVQIGKEYWVIVAGRLARVRVNHPAYRTVGRGCKEQTGWWTTMVSTGRLVRIRLDARLKRAPTVVRPDGGQCGCPHERGQPCQVCECALAAAQETARALRAEV